MEQLNVIPITFSVVFMLCLRIDLTDKDVGLIFPITLECNKWPQQYHKTQQIMCIPCTKEDELESTMSRIIEYY